MFGELDWGFIDNIKPKYKCIKDFKTIKQGDIVNVEIKISEFHESILITFNKYGHYVNSLTLDEYFEKVV